MSSEREQLKVKIAEKMGWGVVPSEGPGYGYYVTGYPSTEEMWIDAEDDLNNLTDACMEVLQAAKAEAEYTRELEKVVIFLCDVYAKGQDSLVCQTNEKGQVDDKWMNIMMSFPTIQGTGNRIYIDRIGKLRTPGLNRESVGMSFQELYERLKVGRREQDLTTPKEERGDMWGDKRGDISPKEEKETE